MKILGYEVSDSDMKRFESHIDKQEDGCWLWTASKGDSGYGRFGIRSGMILRAHRFSYELYIGKIPKHLQLDHLCRVRHCVNPSHLEPVTMKENCGRGYWASRKECSKGHPYTAKNTYYGKAGNRACRACGCLRMKKQYQKRKSRKST